MDAEEEEWEARKGRKIREKEMDGKEFKKDEEEEGKTGRRTGR